MRRRPEPGGLGVRLLGGLLVLVGGGLLAGAYLLVAREDRAPGPPGPAPTLPFDAPVVEDGVWVLELHVTGRWDGELADRVAARLRATRDFVRDGRFAALYPEALGREVRVRVRCAHPPPERDLRRLAEMDKQMDGLRLEVLPGWG